MTPGFKNPSGSELACLKLAIVLLSVRIHQAKRTSPTTGGRMVTKDRGSEVTILMTLKTQAQLERRDRKGQDVHGLFEDRRASQSASRGCVTEPQSNIEMALAQQEQFAQTAKSCRTFAVGTMNENRKA